MQYVVFAAFFEVQDELNRDARLRWPLRMRDVTTIAVEIAGVIFGAVVNHGVRYKKGRLKKDVWRCLTNCPP